MKRFKSLRLQVACGVILIVFATAMALFVTLERHSEQALVKAAQARQDTSLRILVDRFMQRYDGITPVYDADGAIEDVRWEELPGIEGHDLIDGVGRISGETATLFAWDPAEGDFIRRTTNIVKPDGTLAVGTYLGTSNPVFASMMEGEIFRGRAVILGNSYLTIYVPIMGPDEQPLGIFYVGVAEAEIAAALQAQRVSALVVVTGLLVLAILATFFGLRFALRPLVRLERAVKRISEGELDRPADGIDRTDEVGRIATTVDGFRLSLQKARLRDEEDARRREEQEQAVEELSQSMARLASKDLGCRIPQAAGFPPEYERLRRDFNAVAENLAGAVADISRVSANVESTASRIGSMSNDLSLRVEKQAASLEETVAGLDLLTQSGDQIATRASEADGLAGESRELSRESGAVLDRAVAAIAEVEAASDQIGRIVEVIEDIAFQTNLLALNAGVEAARAGEAGKGFSVVATEVRGLAHRASDSAGEIRNLVQSTVNQVRDGSQLVRDTGTSISQVLEKVHALGSLVSAIATDVEGQARSMSEINVGMQQLDVATQESAALAAEADGASQELQSEARALAHTLDSFSHHDTGEGKATGGAVQSRAA